MKKRRIFFGIWGTLSVLLCCSREYELDAQFGSVKITPNSGMTTSESGTAVTMQVQLTYPPIADVVLSMGSSNTNEGQIRANGTQCDASGLPTAGTCTLTFTPQNWNIAQNLIIVGQEDDTEDGTVEYRLQTTVSSADARYQNLQVSAVILSNSDNDAGAEIILSGTSGLTTRESGAMTASFQVRLGTQPAANVVFGNVRSDTPTEGAVISATTLTFTPANWSVDQTVIISGVADNKIDGDSTYRVISDAATGPAPYKDKTLSVTATNVNTDSGKYFFVTTSAYAVTVNAPLVGGIAGADAKCNAEKPNGSTYKAVLGAVNGGGTTIRDPGLDWVLSANTKYFRFADRVLIGTTNAGRIFDLTTALNGGFAPGATYWSGFSDGSWNVTSGSSCNAFLSGTGANIGDGSSTGQTAIKSGGGVLCNTAQRLLCAEQ